MGVRRKGRPRKFNGNLRLDEVSPTSSNPYNVSFIPGRR